MNIKNTQLFNSKAFTLIELLAVMVIILIIAGMFVGVSGPASQSAKKRKAEVMISALEVAISMYHADTGAYPPVDGAVPGSVNLYDYLYESHHGTLLDPEYVAGWAGPYMEFKDEDLISSGSGGIKDPWGKAYRYNSFNPTQNPNSFDLWSWGPKGTDEWGTIDKINNW